MPTPNHALLITGGVLRPDGFELGEGKYYGGARLLKLDTRTGAVQTLLAVDEGTANFPAEHPNLEFTVSCREGHTLWLAMDTEVRRYSYPALELQATFSHPCFQNIHSVAVRGGSLYVTSTGLDLVVVLGKETGVVQQVLNVEGLDPWHRFARSVDWRQVHSTRPHDCHPNHVFWLGDEPWVTRCTPEDAVPLLNTGRRIDLSGTKREIAVHDGVVHEGSVFFTLVDGTVVVMDAADPERPLRNIELAALPGFGGVRGWCRGLCFANGLAYLGFSRLRRTRNQRKLDWVRRTVGRGETVQQASVLAVDLQAGRIVKDYRLPLGSIDAVYGIMTAPGEDG
jgi:hypothetical protein